MHNYQFLDTSVLLEGVNLSLSGWGQRIRQARMDLAAKRGRTVTQVEVAERVGVSSVTVGYWEAERSEPDDLATWRKLAKALETTPSFLAFGEQHEVRVYRETPRDEPTAPAASQAPPKRRRGRSA